MKARIPARIIQTGKSSDLPLLARAAVANLKCLNPDFEYLFFDDRDVAAFLQEEFPQYAEIFQGFPFPIQRYDFFRYLAVFHFGGFYFDLDVFLASNLDPLLSTGCVFPFEEITINNCLRYRFGMDWELGNYAFGAAPGHPFLRAVIENCVKAQEDPAWAEPMMQGLPRLFRAEFQVLNTTGPGLLSRTLAESPHLSGDVCVLFPEDVCESRNWHQFGNYGVHLMEGSWRVRGNYLRRRLGTLWEVWATRRALAASRRAGKTRQVQAKKVLAARVA